VTKRSFFYFNKKMNTSKNKPINKKNLYFNKDIISNSSKETAVLAKKFAQNLNFGDNIFLIGDLGAGKTIFTQSLLKSLGVKNIINSPSFKLINEYDISFNSKNIKCYHFDLYRLESIEEILYLGWEEMINSTENICIIEWADRAKELWKNTKSQQNTFYQININYRFNKIDFSSIKNINQQERTINIKKLG
jgi:tRNA threonylcarbamoyladenosine biosynthesis protein TsaE